MKRGLKDTNLSLLLVGLKTLLEKFRKIFVKQLIKRALILNI